MKRFINKPKWSVKSQNTKRKNKIGEHKKKRNYRPLLHILIFVIFIEGIHKICYFENLITFWRESIHMLFIHFSHTSWPSNRNSFWKTLTDSEHHSWKCWKWIYYMSLLCHSFWNIIKWGYSRSNTNSKRGNVSEKFGFMM